MPDGRKTLKWYNFFIVDNILICKCIDVKKLPNVFCKNIYSSELLDLGNKDMNTIYVAYRKCIRRVFKLSYRTHNFIINRTDKTTEIRLNEKTARSIYNLLNSSNNIMLQSISCSIIIKCYLKIYN